MTNHELIEEALTYSVIGAFFEVYNELGFGFLEHLYVLALERELIARGHPVRREVWVEVMYKGNVLGRQRLDMVVDDKLVIEAKSRTSSARKIRASSTTTFTQRNSRSACSSTSAPKPSSIA